MFFLNIFRISVDVFGKNCQDHKVLTYVEYRAVSDVFQNIDPPPPSSPSECVLPPPHQRRGLHTRRAVRGMGAIGGSVFLKTPAIGLASYNNLSTTKRHRVDALPDDMQ